MENVTLRDVETAKKHQEVRSQIKKGYSAVDDEEFTLGKKKSILSHYDEEDPTAGKTKYTLDQDGNLKVAKAEQTPEDLLRQLTESLDYESTFT
jgi:exopolysaccharide biosynthesis protein